MDSFIVFWLVFFLLLIALGVGLIYLSFWLGKRLGKKRTGFFISSILAMGALALVFSFVFEDALFSKQDAREKLLEHGIDLKNEFKINSNHMSGVKDYSHSFELTISINDKQTLKNRILTAESYRDSVPYDFQLWKEKPRYSDTDTTFTINYQNSENYIYEFYKPNKQGIKPIWDKVLVSKGDNRLKYERILN